MFGNPKKIDPKIRFQYSSFKRQLNQARGYKRPIRDLGKKKKNEFWEKIGFGSWAKKITALILMGFALYFIYFPNFLSVKTIDINGLQKQDREQVQKSVNAYLNKLSLLPQKNLSLLSPKKLADAILQQGQTVLKVNSIKKAYPNTLIINLSPRQDSFYLKVGDSAFTVSSDGIISSEAANADTASTTLLNLKIQTGTIPSLTQKYLSADFANMLLQLQATWPQVLGSNIGSIEFLDLKNTESTVITQLGYKIKLDFRLDLNETLNRLKLILADFPDDHKKNLSYIDLRLKNRVFVCQKTSPCSKETSTTAAPNASSSPATIKK